MTTTFSEEISQNYKKILKTNHLLLSWEPDSVLHYAGDVKGKKILDLGCGEGSICRTLKKKGAELVIGVDKSESLIKMAKEEEDKESLGIDYLVQDVRTMKKIGEFDIILGNLVLCYAENKKEPKAFANAVYKNLQGRCISFSPDIDSQRMAFALLLGSCMILLMDTGSRYKISQIIL